MTTPSYLHIERILRAYYAVVNAPDSWKDDFYDRVLAKEWSTPTKYHEDRLVRLLREAAQEGVHLEEKKITIRPGLEINPKVYLTTLMKEYMPKEEAAALSCPASS